MVSIEKEVLLLNISKKLTNNFVFKPRTDDLFQDLYECACNECQKHNQPEEILDNCYFHIDEMNNTISILEKKTYNPFEEENNIHNNTPPPSQEEDYNFSFEEHAFFAGGSLANLSYI